MLGGVSIEFKHVGRSSALVLTMIDPALVSAATPPSAAPRMHELLACRFLACRELLEHRSQALL